MPLAAVAHALDRARAPMLRAALARSPWLRQAARSRARRIEIFAAVSLLVALPATLVAPTLLFVWGPLLLGVPHLVADVRYLTLAPYAPIARRARDLGVVMLLGACLWSPSPRLGGAAVLAALLLSPLPAATPRGLAVRTAWCSIAAATYALAWRFPTVSLYVLLHAHNLVAVLLFACVFGRARARWLVPAMVAAVTALVLLGALDSLLRRVELDELAGYLLPRAALDAWAPLACARVTALFVFLQGVHYTIWLRLIPEQTRSRNGLRGFGASLRALQRDLGRPLVLLLAALALGLMIFGLVDGLAARQGYLRLAGFHAYLELAFLARWLSTWSPGPRSMRPSVAT